MEDITSQGASHLAGTRRGFVSEVLRCNSSSSSGVMINMIQRWGMFHSLEGGGGGVEVVIWRVRVGGDWSSVH